MLFRSYYGSKIPLTHENFIENLQRVVNFAAEHQVMISIETMDDCFINSIAKIKNVKKSIVSPWLQAYPDLGNISAWPDNQPKEDLTQGLDSIIAIHVKDVLSVTDQSSGKFKDVPFGEGDVNFLGLFKALKRVGYQGTFTIEMWSENDIDADSKVVFAHDFIVDLLTQSGLLVEM